MSDKNIVEKKRKRKSRKIKGDFLVIPQERISTELFEAMMAFQYGETEESDAGFEEMKRLSSAPD